MHHDDRGSRSADKAVAVVGLSAILPDAPDADSFWQNVLSGRDSITEIPSDRWNTADHYDPDPAVPDKTYCKIGAFVRGFRFDGVKYRIPLPVVTAMDQSQQWMLECARLALLDAGHPDGKLDPERIGVVVGNALGGERHQETTHRVAWPAMAHAINDTPEFGALPPAARAAILAGAQQRFLGGLPPITADSMPGELTNVIAGRVTNTLDLRGPNFSVDAACASSLGALLSAMALLNQGQADAVVTGGVDRTMGPSTFVKFAKIGALSPDGSRPFDARANGFVMGEGCVALVLRRLADAERDGQRIYAVIRAVGASSDGRGKGITAPNPKGQYLSIRRAYEQAGFSLGTIGLVEAHGTSTKVGDAVEAEALGTLFGELGLRPHSVALGSVKSQIGHLKSAAGAVGLLKAIFALHHKVLPPTINVREPNPAVPFDKLPIYLNLAAQPWERPQNGVRRASVSSFGFGGTNFHVVLEEYVPGMLASVGRPQISVSEPPKTAGSQGLLCLGGASVNDVRSRLQSLSADPQRAMAMPPVAAQELTASERVAIAFTSPTDFADKAKQAITALDSGDARAWRLLRSRGVHRGSGARAKLAFLFPGQGSQYLGMLKQLRDSEPEVRASFAEGDEVMAASLQRRLSDYVYAEKSDEADAALRDTSVCQPAMLAADVGLLRLLGRYGMHPDIVMGHSLGEYAALVAAGSLTFANAVRAVSARAREMASVSIADNGRMASVFASYEAVEQVIRQVNDYVVAANFNGRSQTVIGGTTKAVEAAVERFAAAGIKAVLLPVSHAFHTEIVAPASKPLRQVLAGLDLKAPKVTIISNVTGEPYPTDPSQHEQRLDLLARQVAAPVQFARGLETAYRLGARVFVEVGPRRVLATFVEDVLGEKGDAIALSTNQPKLGERESFSSALAGLYAAGYGQPLASVSSEESMTTSSSRDAVGGASGLVPSFATSSAMQTATSTTPQGSDASHLALGRAFAQFFEEGLRMYQQTHTGPQVAPAVETVATGSVVVTGAALGLPGRDREVFAEDNVERILRGDSFIDAVPEDTRQRMAEKRVTRLVKGRDGSANLEVISDPKDVLKLAGQRGRFDLTNDFGVDAERVAALDITSQLAIGAGLMALRDAGIPLVRRYKQTSRGSYLPEGWVLPESLADETGVVFSSAWPAMQAVLTDVDRFYSDRALHERLADLKAVRGRLEGEAAKVVDDRIKLVETELAAHGFNFDRRFIFRSLSMGHSQIAELIGARGPNMQINAACASSAAAMGVAQDWIRAGRCRRVIVVSADDTGTGPLFDWIGAGMLAAGAATTEAELERAALPFDRRRNGMIIGMGASSLVVESEDAVRERGMRGIAEILGVEAVNSAFHGTRLDVEHISSAMERLVSRVERQYGISRQEIATQGVFVSHETYTPARGGSAAAEIHSVRRTFGANANDIVIANTKGMTGHAMGAGIEEAVAVKILETGIVPPVVNLREPDPELGNLKLSQGGRYPVRYAVRFAAGFGSQLVLTILRKLGGARQADQATYQRWVESHAGRPGATLVVENKALHVRDDGPATQQPARSSWTFGQGPRLQARPETGDSVAAPAVRAVQPQASVPPVAAASATPIAAQAPQAPVATAGVDEVAEKLLGLVATKTGYPRHMLALDLDLEADLGIDTVKQAEIFSEVRGVFGLPRRDDLRLRDYPTLKHILGFVRSSRPDLAAAPTAAAPVVAAPTATAASVASAQASTAASSSPVTNRLLEIVAAKTGYPGHMLALDLDLEADLGIDTVKQAEIFAELRTAFELPRRDELKLRDYPTLGHLARLIGELRPELAVSSTPVASVSAAPVATSPTAVAAPAVAGDDIRSRVLELVATTTGYPREMLDLDLDLEADLGIDTVKQAEIFAKIRTVFDLPRRDDLKLRDYPTLGRLIELARTMRTDAAPAAVVTKPSGDTAATATVEVAPVLRRVPVPVVRPDLDLCKPTTVTLTAGKRIVVLPDVTGVAAVLCQVLADRGVEVLRLDGDNYEDQVQAWLQKGAIDGLYDLSALDPEPDLLTAPIADVRTALQSRVGRLSRVCRVLSATLARAGSFIVAGTRLGGMHGYGEEAALAPAGGCVAGFVKAIGRELGDTLVKVVDFEGAADAKRIATTLVVETERDPAVVEVGYAHGARHAIGFMEVMASDKVVHALGADAVVLVTGAAGGITAAIAADIAGRSHGTFYLTDIAPVPADNNPDRDRLANDREGLKRDLFERRKATGERVTPVQIEAALAGLEREKALVDAIQAITRAGGRARYFSGDARDDAAMSAIVAEIKKSHSRIDLIVHAAGLERSRALADKPREEFDRIVEVKALGLANVLKATAKMEVGAIVCFSSIAGRFGNAGQTDYSAANDFLCKAMLSMPRWRPNTRGIAIDWTAWGDVGMATRGSIPEVMKRAGIDMLPLVQGLPVVWREVTTGTRGEVIIAKNLGVLVAPRDEQGGIATDRIAAKAGVGALPMVGKVVSMHLYEGLRVETTLDPRSEPFLLDHKIDGVAVLPGVMGVEGFVEVAHLLFPDHRVVGLENVRFEAPFKFHRDEQRTGVFRAMLRSNGADEILADLTLSSSQKLVDGELREKRHFSGTVRLSRAKAPQKPKRNGKQTSGKRRDKIGFDDIYRVFFHGPAYQVMDGAEATEHGARSHMRASLPPALAGTGRATEFSPRIIELCLQTAGVYELGVSGRMGLPAGIDRIVSYEVLGEADELTVEVEPQASEGELAFNARVCDAKGRVCLDLLGYRTSVLPTSLPEALLLPLRKPFAKEQA